MSHNPPSLPPGDDSDDDFDGIGRRESGLSPEEATWLKVRFRIRVRFIIEQAGVDLPDNPRRKDITEAITNLSHAMQMALRQRERRAKTKLDELFTGDIKRFDEPKVDTSDLPPDEREALELE